MGTKKENPETKTEEMVTDETKTEEMVTIKLPRIKGGEDAVYVSINERNWLIKRGVAVDVPKCVADLLDQQDKALDEAYQRQEAAKRASAEK